MMTSSAIVQTDAMLTFPVKLPVPGTVKVHLGQNVEPGTVIAEAVLPARFQVFDVFNQFRLKESNLESCIKRLAGEDVKRGDVIAKKPGLISRIFRAPEDGKVVSVRDGRVTLAMGEKTIQTLTPVGGVVSELIPGLGAVIVDRGFSLRGNWGNDKTAVGNLVIPAEGVEVKDAIVFLDQNAGLEDIKAVKEKGAVGIIVTSLDPFSKTGLEQFELPVMSLLGFGEARLDTVSQSAIEELQGSQVTLVARKAEPYRGLRPELFQHRETEKTAELFTEAKQTLLGKTVRLLGQPYFGNAGEVVELPDKPERLPNGLRSKVAVVKRKDGTVIRVPVQNLEILTD